MKPRNILLAGAAIAAIAAGAAIAHGYGEHYRGSGGAQGATGPWTMTPWGQMPGMMGGPSYGMMDGPGMMGGAQGMMPMMQMMMGMHGGGMHGGGMFGGAPGYGMGMFGGDMMPGLGAQGDPAALAERLEALFERFDADGNGALSLEEFTALHTELMREAIVDRFQYLDDDGDGAVTAEEIRKPARILERMREWRERMMPRPLPREGAVGPDRDGMMPGGGRMTGGNGQRPSNGGMVQGN